MSVTVFPNAALFDGSAHLGRVGDVVVSDGRITAVGTDSGRSGRGSSTSTAGSCCRASPTPTCTRSRAGSSGSAATSAGCPADAPATSRHVGEHAAASRDGWIQGGGWAMAAFPGGLPTARELDEVVGDRPVALANRDHHGMWVNTRALAVAGITARTPDPADGRIERDADGTPDRRAARGRDGDARPRAPGRRRRPAVRRVPRGPAPPPLAGDHRLAGRHRRRLLRHARPGPDLRPRGRGRRPHRHRRGALWWDRTRGREQVAELLAKREDWTRGRFSATAVKIMQDGVAENGTAALVEPYLDRCGHATGNAGISFVDPARLRRYVGELDAPRLPGPLPWPGRPGGARGARRPRGHRPAPPPPDRPPPARAPR